MWIFLVEKNVMQDVVPLTGRISGPTIPELRHSPANPSYLLCFLNGAKTGI